MTRKKKKTWPIIFNGGLDMREQAAFASLLVPLMGRTIKSAIVEKDDDSWGEYWIALVLDDGTQITALRDSEGNGPGHLDVTRPEKKKRPDPIKWERVHGVNDKSDCGKFYVIKGTSGNLGEEGRIFFYVRYKDENGRTRSSAHFATRAEAKGCATALNIAGAAH